MSVPVIVPKFASDDADAVISKWFVAEGDAVRAGDLLLAVERDHATIDIEAAADGVVHGGRPAGVSAMAGAVIARILAPGEMAEPLSEPEASAPPAVVHTLPGAWTALVDETDAADEPAAPDDPGFGTTVDESAEAEALFHWHDDDDAPPTTDAYQGMAALAESSVNPTAETPPAEASAWDSSDTWAFLDDPEDSLDDIQPAAIGETTPAETPDAPVPQFADVATESDARTGHDSEPSSEPVDDAGDPPWVFDHEVSTAAEEDTPHETAWETGRAGAVDEPATVAAEGDWMPVEAENAASESTGGAPGLYLLESTNGEPAEGPSSDGDDATPSHDAPAHDVAAASAYAEPVDEPTVDELDPADWVFDDAPSENAARRAGLLDVIAFHDGGDWLVPPDLPLRMPVDPVTSHHAPRRVGRLPGADHHDEHAIRRASEGDATAAVSLSLSIDVDVSELRDALAVDEAPGEASPASADCAVVAAVGRALAGWDRFAGEIVSIGLRVPGPSEDRVYRFRDAGARPVPVVVDSADATDLTEPSCTVTSFAAFGVREATACLDGGSAIAFAVGAIRDEAMFEGRAVVPVSRMTISLTYDADEITGGAAASLLGRVAEHLQQPAGLLAA